MKQPLILLPATLLDSFRECAMHKKRTCYTCDIVSTRSSANWSLAHLRQSSHSNLQLQQPSSSQHQLRYASRQSEVSPPSGYVVDFIGILILVEPSRSFFSCWCLRRQNLLLYTTLVYMRYKLFQRTVPRPKSTHDCRLCLSFLLWLFKVSAGSI